MQNVTNKWVSDYLKIHLNNDTLWLIMFFCVSVAATPIASQGQGQAASGHFS